MLLSWSASGGGCQGGNEGCGNARRAARKLTGMLHWIPALRKCRALPGKPTKQARGPDVGSASLIILLALALAVVAWLGWQLRRRSMDRWLLPYVLSTRKRRAPRGGESVHLLLCLADHYEPKWEKASPEVARQRVARWVEE